MLAQSEMTVVFVLDQSISPGTLYGVTAGSIPKASCYGKEPLKVPQRRACTETYRVEQVNPASEKPKFGRGTGKCK